MGVVYYDYTPANLLFENNQVFLADPPDVLRHGVLLWDFHTSAVPCDATYGVQLAATL